MTAQVALLRGINLGAKRRVPMAKLREVLAEAGFREVRTHLQSGNVLLRSDDAPGDVARALEGLIGDAFGFEVPVLVRTRDELAAVVAGDPFGDVVTDPKRYQVVFLSGPPPAEAVARVEAADIGEERVAFSEREIYAWHAGGIQDSPLAKLLVDAKLGVTATARNWRTVTKLLELADAG